MEVHQEPRLGLRSRRRGCNPADQQSRHLGVGPLHDLFRVLEHRIAVEACRFEVVVKRAGVKQVEALRKQLRRPLCHLQQAAPRPPRGMGLLASACWAHSSPKKWYEEAAATWHQRCAVGPVMDVHYK